MKKRDSLLKLYFYLNTLSRNIFYSIEQLVSMSEVLPYSCVSRHTTKKVYAAVIVLELAIKLKQ
jgi:hypothetical protein